MHAAQHQQRARCVLPSHGASSLILKTTFWTLVASLNSVLKDGLQILRKYLWKFEKKIEFFLGFENRRPNPAVFDGFLGVEKRVNLYGF